MIREPRISLNQLVGSLSDAVDLVSSSLVDHHKHVAYIAFCLATELGISMDDRSDLVLAGLLHDIGAVSLKDRLDLLQFEIEIPHQHSQLAYLLLRMFEPLKEIGNLVRCHHVFFDYGKRVSHMGSPVPRGSHILHLADRIAVSVKRNSPIFDQTVAIRKSIESQTGKMFDPEMVEAFKTLATREAFWLDLTSRNIHEFLQRRVFFRTVELDLTGIWGLGNLFRRIIDFRSPFTATHSSGVAASAKALGEFSRLSESECKMLEIAGFIHDLGKLAVPTEVLELPRALTREEFNIVRAHTYFTYRVLEPIVDF